MKKHIVLSGLIIGLLSSVNAAEDLSSMFTEGKVSGQIRMFSIDRTYQGSAGNSLHRNGTALGGHLKFETGDYKGLKAAVGFYTTNHIASSPTVDPTLFGENNDGYSIIGEAYLQYTRQNTTFKGGRQTLETPMAGGDDARMIRNLFEAYILTNKDIKDTTLIAGHITKFAQGTFGRAYSSSSAANQLLSITSGYSYVDPKNQVGHFENIGTYALGQSTSGISLASVTYSGVKNLKVQLWDYYAYDILNVVYGQADFSWKCLLNDNVHPFISGQFIKENDVGNKYAGTLNGLYWAAKIGAKVENFAAYVAYSQTSDNSASEAAAGGTANAIITPWGGMPAFTQGMVTRHMFLAGTKATKVAASYNFKNLGANLSTAVYYASFDMDANSGYGIARTAYEPGFDIKYYPAAIKNLQVRFRGNFPRKFAESTSTSGDTGWSEYRFIVNYNF